ncbi:esterase-like activity of phytase family protein [Crenalkalicoccus roseus]|uniref:esterase-like activity of phytase family protein n=1 Tax=Crenalkalicoccus roseus TaxID=1485588 RepID=UPI001081B628|nr:esterase-like activity of phytase family protein [Crenalkalicoccus roseus]
MIAPGGTGRRAFLLGAAGVLAASACAAEKAERPLARPVPLQVPPGSPLEPLGALVLDGAEPAFRGLSGLRLDDALRLTAVSDLGHWMSARLVLQEGRPVGLEDLRSGPLRDGAGQPLGRGWAGDAEALARLPDGTWLVAFERWHRIRAYADLDGPASYVPAPPGLERAPRNGGLESLAVLADGRWLLITEMLAPPEAPDLRLGWLGRPDAWMEVAYRPAEGLHPVDAAPLPDGGALVLERRFSLLGGFTGRLARLSPGALAGARPGTVLEGETLLALAPPLPTDNYEGVGTARLGGRTLVALVSDDNENPLQRAWLLLFLLADD